MSSRRRSRIFASVLVGALLLAPTVLAAPFWDLPEAATESQGRIRALYDQIFWVALVIFVLVEGWLVYTVFRWGPKGGGEEGTEHHERGHNVIEVTWTIIPALILLWVGIASFGVLGHIETPPAEDVRIDVVGHQWYWEWRYPNGVRISDTANGEDPASYFHVPADQFVVLNLTSADVIHAIGVRELALKLDAVPGRLNTAWFRADDPGIHVLQCQEYCGLNHGYMRSKIVVEPRAAYEAWLALMLERQKPESPTATISLTMGDDAMDPAEVVAVVGTNLTLEVRNAGASARAFSVDGPVSLVTDPIPPGETASLSFLVEAAFETMYGAADAEGRAAGIMGHLHAAQADVVEVTLEDFKVTLSKSTFETGKTYLFKVSNKPDSVTHNFYGGKWSRTAAEKEVIFESATLDGGQETELLWTPERAGDFEAWCDIPGHYQAGMRVPFKVT